MAELTEQQKTVAAEIVSQWYWQTDETHEHSLVRYYESAPLESDVFRLVVEFLANEKGITSVSIHGKAHPLSGVWRAVDAWYRTFDSDVDETTKLKRVRIYQRITDLPDGGEAVVVEKGCRYRVTHTFHWDVSELPTVPQSTSGVSYTMQGVSRDKETGLYSCVIEKKERQQQDINEYKTAETVFEKRDEQQHLGVREANLQTAGKAASVGGGVLVERRLTKNEDCTTNVENVTTTEKPVADAVVVTRKTLRGTVTSKTDRNQTAPLSSAGLEVGETRRSEKTPGGRYNNTVEKTVPEPVGKIASDCAKTIFEHTDAETVNQATQPTDEAAEAGDGRTHRKTSRKTEEGTYDVTTTDMTEKPVADAVVVTRKTLRGTVTSKTDRNQTAPLSSAGLEVGETRRSEKTPGGRYNNTVEKVEREAVGRIGSDCQKTVFVHIHSTMDNVGTAPTDETTEAGGGRFYRRNMRRTEEGTFDVTDTATTEKSVPNAIVTVRKSVRATVKETTSRSQGAALQAPEEIGGSVTNRVTDGRLFDTVEVVTTPAKPVAKIKKWTTNNKRHVRMAYYNFKEPVVASAGGYLSGGGAGVAIDDDADITCSFQLNELGLWDGTVHAVWQTKDSAGSTVVKALFWEKTENNFTTKYFYSNPVTHKMCYRLITCDKYSCYGPYRTVKERVNGGENCPQCGWHSGSKMVTIDTANGEKYTNIQMGAEMQVDQQSQVNS